MRLLRWRYRLICCATPHLESSSCPPDRKTHKHGLRELESFQKMVCTSLEAYWWDLSISAKNFFCRIWTLTTGGQKRLKNYPLRPYKTKMAILRLKITKGGGVKYFRRVSIWNFSFKWFCTFITLFYPQHGPNPGKRHFSVKKAPKIRFCAAISQPIVVISTF